MAVVTTSLSETLKYQNPALLARFIAEHNYSRDDAEIIFTETKKWLWLCAHQFFNHPEAKPLNLFFEARAIDEMWHTFLLFTRDYAEFCSKYLGTFVHHVPQTEMEKEKARQEEKENPEVYREKRLVDLRETYEYIYDHLGAKVLTRWCEELPQPR